MCVCAFVREHLCCRPSYFFTTPPLSATFTGIVVSEDSMAGLIKGASIVRTPSGDREDVTFSMLAAAGRLVGRNATQLGCVSVVFFVLFQCF